MKTRLAGWIFSAYLLIACSAFIILTSFYRHDTRQTDAKLKQRRQPTRERGWLVMICLVIIYISIQDAINRQIMYRSILSRWLCTGWCSVFRLMIDYNNNKLLRVSSRILLASSLPQKSNLYLTSGNPITRVLYLEACCDSLSFKNTILVIIRFFVGVPSLSIPVYRFQL